jgi:hypothetical protein
MLMGLGSLEIFDMGAIQLLHTMVTYPYKVGRSIVEDCFLWRWPWHSKCRLPVSLLAPSPALTLHGYDFQCYELNVPHHDKWSGCWPCVEINLALNTSTTNPVKGYLAGWNGRCSAGTWNRYGWSTSEQALQGINSQLNLDTASWYGLEYIPPPSSAPYRHYWVLYCATCRERHLWGDQLASMHIWREKVGDRKMTIVMCSKGKSRYALRGSVRATTPSQSLIISALQWNQLDRHYLSCEFMIL